MANSLTFAVPVEWNKTTAYEINNIVFIGKQAYTAIQDVPTGIEITNTAYWSETGVPYVDLTSIRNKLNELESDMDDAQSDITQAQSDIVSNANNITSLNTRLTNAVASIEADATRLNNVIITLYTPYSAS